MNAQQVIDILIAIAAVIWLGYRQTTWRAVSPERMWRMPVILIVIGAVGLASGNSGQSLNFQTLEFLAVELLVSAAIGAVIGLIAHLRPVSDAALLAHAESRRAAGPAPTFEVRNGLWGLVLWIVLIAVRIGMMVWAARSGLGIEAMPTAIVLMLGVNRLVRTAIVVQRVRRPLALVAR